MCRQALFSRREMLDALARWPPLDHGVALSRLLQAGSWKIQMLIEWWHQVALTTLPPPEDGTLYLVGTGSDTGKRERRTLWPRKSAKVHNSMIFRSAFCAVDRQLGRLSLAGGLSPDSAQTSSGIPTDLCGWIVSPSMGTRPVHRSMRRSIGLGRDPRAALPSSSSAYDPFVNATALMAHLDALRRAGHSCVQIAEPLHCAGFYW